MNMNFLAEWKEKHPRFYTLLEQFVKFYLISLLVTLFQYLMLTFLPGIISAMTDWELFDCFLIPVFSTGKYIFNYSAANGGMAYFAAYGVTLFLAQCINFPMQRNLTFKSHGNIWWQIFWYLIAFVLIFMACSGLQAFYQPILQKYLVSPVLYNVVITVVNGGIQMVIYFPIYKIIFPEGKGRDES